MQHAVIAIEDQRFYEHKGVDYSGIARALWQDVVASGARQGGSTITQQFVKNALAAQNDRTLFQKLREAALAYQLERKWSKEKILTEYLNPSTSATAPTGSSRRRASTSAGTTRGCEPRLRRARASSRRRGRAAGRHDRLARAPTARSQQPAPRRSSGATSCSQRMHEQG